MPHIGCQCHCVLFNEVCILGNAAFTRKPIANQNDGTVPAYDLHGRGQYVWSVKKQMFTAFTCAWFKLPLISDIFVQDLVARDLPIQFPLQSIV